MTENDKIIDMARALGRAVQMDERYLALKAIRDENDADEALQKMIGEFNLSRMNLNTEVAKEERDNEKIAHMNEELQRLYDEVMNSPGMQKYEKNKAGVEDMFSYINAIITEAVNGGDVEAVTQPSACGCDSGDCGGCTSCG